MLHFESGINLEPSKYLADLVEAQFKRIVRGSKECFQVIDQLGYTYSRADKNAPETSTTFTWRCSKKSKGCRASVVTENKWIVKTRNQHNHEPAFNFQ